MAEYAAPRGTHDVLPAESPKWEYVESRFKNMCRLYGYKELRTPTFEHTELFTRNLGETTDVVSKEMYTFSSRGDKSLTLRPEGTAPAVRAYVQHNLSANLPVNKVYYIGRIFRYERPQAGRYREHTQMGIEAFGSIDPAIDAEVIALAVSFYKSIGLTKFDLRINSIGCQDCRPAYRQALIEYTKDRLEKLCPTCIRRYEQNPMRMLDCKEKSCKAALADAPRFTDHIGPECKEHFEKVQQYLRELDIGFIVDPKLVRGFDYYIKTAFEFYSSELGAQNALGGGGRYDNLVQEIGGPPTPAIGFGLGLDRLMLVLDALNIEFPVDGIIDAFVAVLGETARAAAPKLLLNLRDNGVSADMDYTGRSLKAQMKLADKLGARFAIILGDDEVASGMATVKDLSTSDQHRVEIGQLPKFLLGDSDKAQ